MLLKSKTKNYLATEKNEIKIGIENVCYWLNVIGILNDGLGRNHGTGTTFIMDVRVTIDTLGKVYINGN